MPQFPLPDERDREIPGLPAEDLDVEVSEETTIEGDLSMKELADGSFEISAAVDEELEPAGFLDNLAETLGQDELRKIASEYIDLLERDKQARERRDEQYEEGLRRTGLGNDAPGGAEFNGASKVVHPLLAESCVDFASRAIKELFPPSGPVKSTIWGKENEERVDLANRKSRYLNWQLTKKMSEYRAELEELLTQLPMGGSQYQKFYYDTRHKRNRTEFVPVDDMLLPFAASDFYSAQRQTHVQHLTRMEFERRVNDGLYLDVVNLMTVPLSEERTASAEANDKIEGRDEDAYNDDGLRDVFEIYSWLSLEGDEITGGDLAPYIVTIDKYTEEVVAIYRNWKEEDSEYQKLDWIVEWKFIPWRGAYAIGFPHLIGGLSGAATGSLRALLDAAHINNSQTLVKLRGSKTSGQNIEVEPTQVAEIEGPAGVDDIRKLLMAMPYNPPSEVLLKLLTWLTAAGKGVIATAEEKLETVGDRTPVGTTQALIEQGSQTYSAIHARLHYSQAKALEIICRLNHTFMDDQETVEELGDLVISREEFRNSHDIQPVSDPNIFSESQRFAQMQGVLQLRQMYNGQTMPNLPFDDIAIARRMMERMRIPDIDSILPEPPKPQNMNPTAENVAGVHGQPIVALPDQNHLAHLYSHIDFCLSPLFANPMFGQKLMPIMLRHIGEHISFYYAELIAKATRYEEQVTVTPTKQLEDVMARANTVVLNQMHAQLQQLLPKIQQIQQLAQQFQPPPPADPAVEATLKAAMAEIERKKMRDQAELEMEKQHKLQILPQLEKAKLSTEVARNTQDNRTKQITELLKNHNDNQTKQHIAAMSVGNDRLMSVYQSKLDQQEAEAGRVHQTSLAKLTKGGGAGEVEPMVSAEDEEMNAEQFQALQQSQQDTSQKLDQLAHAMAQLVQMVGAPKQVVRDQQGKVVGVQTVVPGAQNGRI
jgi:hypothetical protein